MNDENKRPKIVYLLNQWKGYVEFCYIPLGNVDLSFMEEKLLKAFVPPFNDQFPAEINKIINAF